jgi:hypothetical protein
MFRVDCVLSEENYVNIVKGNIRPELKELDSPYFILFYEVILATAKLMEKAHLHGTVDWVFDEKDSIGIQAVSWYAWIKKQAKPNLRRRLGSTPIFRDDENVLPLKAADLFAWQIRKHISDEQPLGIQRNEILGSFLAKYGASCFMTAEHLAKLVQALNSGLLYLGANCQFGPFDPSKSGSVYVT